MSDFIIKHKKLFIIILSAVGTALCTTIAVLLIVMGMQRVAPSFNEVSTHSTVSDIAGLPDESSVPQAPVEPEDKGPMLTFTSSASTDFTVTVPKYTITGTADPKEKLTMNQQDVTMDANGSFSIPVELNIGANRFVFNHKGEERALTIRYRYVVINGYSPSKGVTLESGATLVVNVSARPDSTVKASFNGTTIDLVRQEIQNNEATEEFINYSGKFTLPGSNRQDLNLGKIKYTATHNGITESFSSGNIICKKTTVPQIAEIIAFTAETFNGATTDDYSDPRNNYLPKGTVDQVVGVVQKGDFTYLKLRCGRRIYLKRRPGKTDPYISVANVYDGTLPTTNSLEVASVSDQGKYTVLTLNTQWKAPFFLDVLPQAYTNPSKRNFTVGAVTGQYVEITFCYATSLSGDIQFSAENPLFSRAQVTPSGTNTVLRLYFKQQGSFRGWDADYNEAGQLVFSFLHPSKAVAAENKYGADLTGIRIVVDAGHGGKDSGAVHSGVAAALGYESHRNFALANMIKAELEDIGAEVIMTRTSDVYLDSDNRRYTLKNAKADYCIAIHHDSANASSANGFGAFHFNAWSSNAAKLVFERTKNTGIYNNNSSHTKLAWHYFFLARAPYCPVVLTENGFISGSQDFPNISSDAQCRKKAEAITQGIVDYFTAY